MISLTCPSCSTKLRVSDDSLSKGRSRAKCPKCQGSVPLPHPTEQTTSQPQADTITVECAACHCRLKAPASRRGSRARCPKCKEEVMIAPAGAPATTSGSEWAAGRAEESASAATRRIDSRALGLFSSGADPVQPPSAEMDLGEVLRSGRELDQPTSPQPAPLLAPSGSDAGIVPSLMNPPTPQLKRSAQEIRDAAMHLGAAPDSDAMQRKKRDEHPAHAAPSTAAPRPAAAQGRAGVAHPPRARAFPLTRGVAAGCLSGLLVGGAATALWSTVGGPSLLWTLAPISWMAGAVALPDALLRVVVLGLLGLLCGAVAAGAGSPTVDDRPLSLLRCGGAGALAGAATGMLSTLASGGTFQVWPLMNWVRDLALVGLLTPAVNRMIPTKRT